MNVLNSFNVGENVEKQFDFGMALSILKEGGRVCRTGWNGKGMWLTLVGFGETDWALLHDEPYACLPWIGMKTADDYFVPWLASQTDMLADDWMVYVA